MSLLKVQYPSEEEEQIALFDRIRWAEIKYPELAFVYHVPNGGWRQRSIAGKFKAMGVRAGVVDVLCHIARNGYHGFARELKVQTATWHDVTKEQRTWLAHFEAQNYDTGWSKGWRPLWNDLMLYLGHPEEIERS